MSHFWYDIYAVASSTYIMPVVNSCSLNLIGIALVSSMIKYRMVCMHRIYGVGKIKMKKK